jgi:uncharacterized membrane protein YhiD involved in acid resistance
MVPFEILISSTLNDPFLMASLKLKVIVLVAIFFPPLPVIVKVKRQVQRQKRQIQTKKTNTKTKKTSTNTKTKKTNTKTKKHKIIQRVNFELIQSKYPGLPFYKNHNT